MACPSAKRQRMGVQLDAYDSSEETDNSDNSEEAPPISERAAAYAPHVRPALDAFWTLDPEAEVHGSHQVGLWDEHSDLDLLTAQPLHQLLRRFRGGRAPRALTLLEHVAQARVPRLLLKHRSGLVLDVVEAKRDPEAVPKDRFVARRLAEDGAAGLARRIKALGRRWAMPREEGYPNCFLFLLMGFWYLARQRPQRPDGEGLKSQEQEERLFRGWLKFLVDSASEPMIFDLREEPEDVGGAEAHWKIVEPVSGRTACSLSRAQVQHIAELAKLELGS